jgi:YggT family protein
MFILGYFLIAVARVLGIILNLYLWLIIIRAVLSWIPSLPYHPVLRQIVQAIYGITDPVLNLIRRRIPAAYGGIDFSPIIVFVAIVFLETFLVGGIQRLAVSFL